MKLFLLFTFLHLVIITLHSSECRTFENCPSCGSQEKWRRKNGNRGKRRNKHGHHRRLGTTNGPLLSTVASSFTNNNSNFSRQFAKFLQNERSGNSWAKNSAVFRKNETTEYTQANVEIMLGLEMEKTPINNRTEEKISLLLPAYKTVGKFGYHSPREAIYGKVVHIADTSIPNSHFGCTGEIANSKEIPPNREPWIALIARGKCTFLVKIKLAETYNASAVVVYDNDPSGSVEVMRTIGKLIIRFHSFSNLLYLSKSFY